MEADGTIVTLLNDGVDKDKIVSAIIVTFVAGSSYDEIFTEHEQKSAEGTQALVYAAYSTDIPRIFKSMKDIESENDRDLLGMIDQIN